MNSEKIKTYYRRKLPHIQGIGETFFITFRLHNSIPKIKLTELRQNLEYSLAKCESIPDFKQRNIEKYKSRRKFFNDYDSLLDKIENGPTYLAHLEVAEMIKEELHRHDGKFYDLLAYTIMSNHVHILIDTAIQLPQYFEEFHQLDKVVPLDRIMKRIKGPTAVRANRILGRNGQFWERESFDVYARDTKMFNNIVSYILNNPIKAGIVKKWQDYKWSYLLTELD